MDSNIYRDDNFGPDQVLPATSFKTSKPDGTVCLYRTEEGPSSEDPVSVYTFFKEAAEKYKDHPALVIRRDKIWRKWCYTDYFQDACVVAKALIKLGLERFYGVCIMGCNCPEWLLSSIGTIFAGGLSVGIYPTNSADACFAIAEDSRAQVIIVEDKIHVENFILKRDLLPNLKALVQWSGEPAYPGVFSWSEFMAIGANEPDEILQKRLSLAAVNQCCAILYTSGTVGPSKGVMLSQDHLTWIAMQHKYSLNLKDKKDVFLSYLPLSHLAAYVTDIFLTGFIGATVYFAPPSALKGSLGHWLTKVRPTIFVGVPRVWEKIYEKMQEATSAAGDMKKSLGTWAKQQGLNYYLALKEGRDLSSSESLKLFAARTLLLNKIKQAIGLDRCHTPVTGAAPLSVEITEYFYSLDIPLCEVYGLSESLGPCSIRHSNDMSIGSVGKIFSFNEVILTHGKKFNEYSDGEGEICIRGRNVCMGYLNMPDKTDEAIDNEGWLHSGDLGWFDPEGNLFISGRLKELVITSGGENVSPFLIEEAIKKELPCVSNAMLIGDKRKYLSILLTLKCELNFDTGKPLEELTASCQAWFKEIGSKSTTVAEVLEEIKDPNGNVAQAIQKGVKRYNKQRAISNAQKLQRWAVLPQDFSITTGELSSTAKLKRAHVLEKYADIIETLYFPEVKTKIPKDKANAVIPEDNAKTVIPEDNAKTVIPEENCI